MLPHNRAPWNNEYFKLEEFETQHIQEGLSDLPLKQVINAPVRVTLLIPGGKGHSYLQR